MGIKFTEIAYNSLTTDNGVRFKIMLFNQASNFLKVTFLLGGLCTFTASASEESSSQALYEKAISAYDSGEVSTSVIHVKNLLQSNSDHLPGRLLFGKILLKYGELAAAEEQYRKALSLNADKSLVIIPLAQTLLLQNKLDQLLSTIQVGNYSSKVNAAALVFRGKAYIGLQQLDDAEHALKSALAYSAQQVDALLTLSQLEYFKGDNEKAEDYVEQAKSIAPQNSHVLYSQGEIYRKRGLVSQALDAYQQAISQNPKNYQALKSRAVLLLDTNQLDSAKQDIDILLAAQPDDPITKMLNAVLLSKRGNKKDAQSILAATSYTFSQVDKEKFEQFAPLSLFDGVTHYLLGNYNDAKKSLSSYLDKTPSSTEARELLAEIATSRGRDQQVIKLLEPIKPTLLSERSAYLLTSAFLNEGFYQSAFSLIENLAPLVQTSEQIQLLHATALIKSNNTNQAIALLKSQLNINEGQYRKALVLGYSYLQQEMYEDALAYASVLLEVKDLPSPIVNYIGVVHQANNQDAKAEHYFRKALLASPNDVVIANNLTGVLLDQQKLRESKEIIDNTLNLAPDNALAHRHISTWYLLNDNPEQAIEHLTKVTMLSPKDLKAKYQLIDLLLERQQGDAVLAQVEAIYELEPLAPAATIAKVKALLILDDLTSAKQQLRSLFSMFSNATDQLTKIAKLQLAAQDIEFAQTTIARIAYLSPEHPDLDLLNALLLSKTNKIEDAISRLRNVESKNASENYLLANLLFDTQDYFGAQQFSARAFTQTQEAKELQLLIKVLWLSNKRTDALTTLEQWLTNNTRDTDMRLMYANLLEQESISEQAIRQYKQVLAAKPTNIFSLNNLALLHMQDENFEQAIEMAEQAYTLEPLNAKVNDTYGWVLVNAGQYEKGLNHLRESFVRNVNQPVTRYHLAVALYKLGRVNESIREVQAALNSEKAFAERESAEALLSKLTQS